MGLKDENSLCKECYAKWHEEALIVGNRHFEEEWILKKGRIHPVSFAIKEEERAIRFLRSQRDVSDSLPSKLKVCRGKSHPNEGESLQVDISLDHGGHPCGYRIKVFPTLGGSIIEAYGFEESVEGVISVQEQADGIERDSERKEVHEADAAIGAFCFSGCHLLVCETQFVEQSDHHANFVHERTWQLHPSESALRLGANLVTVEDPATGDGMIFLLLAPSRLVREAWSAACDFFIKTLRDEGGFFSRLAAFPGFYPLVHLGYRGGRAGRTLVLHALQKSFHEMNAARDGLLLSNTWGDRGRADRLGEAFMRKEIESAAALGVEVVQMDDGWQQGRSANTVETGGVWNGFWEVPGFWEADSVRFPGGLAAVAQAAQSRGIRLGLWYAPDSSREMENWEKDAATLLRYWREWDVCHFKLDAIKLHSPLAEQRLHALLNRVHQESGGRVLFDLDATAEHRTTYWGHMSGSTLFLENRYTDRASYFPHQTLRALWTLSWHVWPLRLRMEFLNPLRNDDLYQEDPLRPSAYPPECLFAITMPASPLAWLENSGLQPETLHRLAGMAAVWKGHRAAWHAGDVLPIGGEPDGYAWTGFFSAAPDRRSGYALIFRELNEEACWQFELPWPLEGDFETFVLAGSGSLDVRGPRMTAEISRKLDFLFARIAESSADH